MKEKDKLSYIDAASVILYTNTDPMHPQAIINAALDQKIIETQGKTPEATMGSRIYNHIQKEGANSSFENIEGKFTLTSKGKKSITNRADLRKHIAKVTPVLYVIENEAIPHYIKIGISTRAGLLGRIRNLSGTSVPLPFDLVYVFAHKKAQQKESFLKKHYAKKKTYKKEFFNKSILDDKELYDLLISMECKEIPISEFQKSGSAKPSKVISPPKKIGGNKPRFSFQMLKIPVGSELSFLDNPHIKCKVANDKNEIIYAGKKNSLSVSAQEIRERLGDGTGPVQGGLYWMYQGETLVARRERMGK